MRSSIALLGGRPFDAARLNFGPGPLWYGFVAACIVCSIDGYFNNDPPLTFDINGLQALAFLTLLRLALLQLLLPASLRTSQFWTGAALLVWAGVIPDALLMALASQEPFDDGRLTRLWPWLCGLVYALWQAAIFNTLLKNLKAVRVERRVLSALAGFALAVCMYWSPVYGLLNTDYYAKYDDTAETKAPEPIYSEELFPRQPQMLDEAFAKLAPRTPGRSNLWFLGFAPYADQDVFVKEATYARKLFEDKLGAQGHSLLLVNHADHTGDLPLATATNLADALQRLGKLMDRDEDILFLYLTSHGGEDGALGINLPGQTFMPVDPRALAQMLKHSGIRWKVIAVSACYSGTYVKPLAAPDTLVMTAARADRTSFGCGDDQDMTYFGRAYFEHALNQTRSFTDAFKLASKEIDAREAEDGYEHAQPQIAEGADIAARLKAAGY